MKKLSIGLLAAVAIAIAAAPADAASKKKPAKAKKGKAEAAKTVDSPPVASLGCFLSAIAGSKSPGPGCGR